MTYIFCLFLALASSPGDNPIVGRWGTGHISSIQYKNAYTGVPGPTNGNRFAYEFRADGTYSFTGLMQMVMHNCTTSTFSNESGTYTMDGGTVNLKPEKNPYRMTYSCFPSSNKEAAGKLIERSYRYRVNGDGLELTGVDGSAQSFRKER